MCRSCWWYPSLDFSCHHEEGDGQLQFEGHWLVADGQHVSSKVMISSWRIDLQNHVSWSHRIAGVNEKTKASEWLNRNIVNIPDATWIYNDHQRYTRIILRIYISHISPYILQWISRLAPGRFPAFASPSWLTTRRPWRGFPMEFPMDSRRNQWNPMDSPRFLWCKKCCKLVEFLLDFTTFIFWWNIYIYIYLYDHIYVNISVWNFAGKNKILGREFFSDLLLTD